jgi:NADP-dependent aldehyde dehydrogenase
MLVPLGPVAVFGASNFPLAFSVAGGDTAAALAAGCPVVVKAHPGHPGTSDLVARATSAAAAKTGMPTGVFGMVQGASVAVGQALVTHPAIKAVGFTGSLRGGRALFDAAARRREPIPVYAEMGSSNPLFVLPRALKERGEAIAKGLAASVTLGAGQFCTNPGLTVLAPADAGETFLRAVGDALAGSPAGTVVHAGIKSAYDAGLAERVSLPGVAMAARAAAKGAHPSTEAQPALLVTDAATFAARAPLHEELYGPATVAVRCTTRDELLDLARGLEGHLTATVHGTEADLAEHADLLAVLGRKVGRLVVNGFPTGVEVSPAMHHGGPYPATTDARATSVGTAAIARFARPLCFQDVPEALLPAELRSANPRGIWRLLDGAFTKEPV